MEKRGFQDGAEKKSEKESLGQPRDRLPWAGVAEGKIGDQAPNDIDQQPCSDQKEEATEKEEGFFPAEKIWCPSGGKWGEQVKDGDLSLEKEFD